MKYGEKLKRERKSLNLILYVLAELSGVSSGELCRYESGKRIPDEIRRVKIQETFDLIRQVQQKYAGISINMKDVKFLRAEIKNLQVAAGN
jgi:transcriptional regulator with XRE-family HTH domain